MRSQSAAVAGPMRLRPCGCGRWSSWRIDGS
jgi:hypothetical protein